MKQRCFLMHSHYLPHLCESICKIPRHHIVDVRCLSAAKNDPSALRSSSLHADAEDKLTQECHLRAGPQSRQHLLRLWLFTDKQNCRTDEQRSHVAEHAVDQERPHHLEKSMIKRFV